MCTGLYSNPAPPPPVEGVAEFESGGGLFMHSSALQSMDKVANKHVVVLGGGKSAVDLTVLCAQGGAASSTMLFRRGHWASPRKIAGLIPFEYVFLSRFGQALVSTAKGPLPGASAALQALHKAVGPATRPVFRIVEELFALQLGLRGDLRPDPDIVRDFYGYAAIHSPEFAKLLRSSGSKLAAVKGAATKLTKDRKLVLQDGREIKADVVVYATGFRRDFSMFDDETRALLDIQDDGLWLYRHLVPAKVPNLAFCGSDVAVISNITTHALAAEWVARVMAGELKLPSQAEMEANVEAMKAWKRSWMPLTSSRAALVLLHQIHYNDQLLQDMGINPRRKSNVLAELLMPYRPADYAGVLG